MELLAELPKELLKDFSVEPSGERLEEIPEDIRMILEFLVGLCKYML